MLHQELRHRSLRLKVVENLGFELGARPGLARPRPEREIVLTELQILSLKQVALGIERVITEVLADFRRRFRKLPGEIGFLGMRAPLEFLVQPLDQVRLDEALDDRALVIHDAVDAEIQFSIVELEQLLQQRLKLLARGGHEFSTLDVIVGLRANW